MNELEKRIRDHYESVDFPPEELAAIRAKGLAAHREEKWRKRARMAALGVAAAILVALFSGPWIRVPVESHERMIAAQVATNHSNHEPGAYKFESTDFSALESQLERLDFSLTAVEAAVRARFDLAGCSYCKVAGNVAVHFNVTERKTGKTGSLYVTARSGELETLNSENLSFSEVEVEMWDDGKRFFAFAATL